MSDDTATPSGFKAVLVTMFELIAFLFAGFNGYLTNLAPPVSRAGGMSPTAAVGFASFAALLMFLLAKVWMRHSRAERYKRFWFATTVALTFAYVASGLEYQRKTGNVTFLYPLGDIEGRVEIVGEQMTPSGQAAMREFTRQNGRDALPAELIAELGGKQSDILVLWDPASIRASHDGLVLRYVAFVVILSAALASLIELMSLSGSVAGAQPTPTPAQPAVDQPNRPPGGAAPPEGGTQALPAGDQAASSVTGAGTTVGAGA